MDTLCGILLAIALLIILMYGCIEVHYFLRTCLTIVLARFFKQRSHILDTTIVNGICLSTDLDGLLCHMNNARYIRELDFARIDFYERTRLFETILSLGGSVYQAAATVRYRRFIRPFHLYKIASRIICWDEQSLFMEHRFIRPSDQFVHCITICRQRVINVSMYQVMELLLAYNSTPTPLALVVDASGGKTNTNAAHVTLEIAQQPSVERGVVVELESRPRSTKQLRPEMPPEIVKWMEYNEISSKNLRHEC